MFKMNGKPSNGMNKQINKYKHKNNNNNNRINERAGMRAGERERCQKNSFRMEKKYCASEYTNHSLFVCANEQCTWLLTFFSLSLVGVWKLFDKALKDYSITQKDMVFFFL